MDMATLADGRDEARRIIAEAEGRGLVLRLLGGLAVAVHSPSARHRGLERSYLDLDFVSSERRGFRLEPFFAELGYEANRSFNLYNGDRRLLFYDEIQQRQVDVFLAAFTMCHSIPLADRLSVEPVTLPLAELLLTKLQIVELNEKDTRDVAAILLDHPLAESDAEALNRPRLEALCGDDWGLWKTVSLSLDKVEQSVAGMDLEPPARATVLDRVGELRRALERAPKSMRWRLRARVGERVRWYELPEEVRRG
jgi:hypothetical protein